MKQRLDRLLVEQKLAPSREKAQAFVMAGIVRVDGQPAGKSGRMISTDSLLEVLGTDQPFVSRGGVKLKPALEYFEIEPKVLSHLTLVPQPEDLLTVYCLVEQKKFLQSM